VRPWPICTGGMPTKKKGMAFSNSPTAQNFFIQGGSADGRWRTNYYVALIEIDTAEPRALIEQIHAAGVPSDVVKYPCQTLYRFPILSSRARNCPNAEALIGRISTVPLHPHLADHEVVGMARVISNISKQYEPKHRLAAHGPAPG
jgi:dTDP-4-amino-4,6-dideoxygalactose transaminase